MTAAEILRACRGSEEIAAADFTEDKYQTNLVDPRHPRSSAAAIQHYQQ
jgi:hypothetical protein